MEDIYIEILSDLIMLLMIAVLIFYLTYRDTKRQDFLDARYDKLITKMIDNIGQQQFSYKTEVVSEVKELSVAMTKVFVGVESVTSGVKDVQTEVIKMTDAVKEVSSGVDRFVSEVNRVTNEVIK